MKRRKVVGPVMKLIWKCNAYDFTLRNSELDASDNTQKF